MVNNEHQQPDHGSQDRHERAVHPRYLLEGRVSLETIGKYHLFLTDDCPAHVRDVLLGLTTEEAVTDFISHLVQLRTPSRRRVYRSPEFSGQNGVVPIFKLKERKPNDPEYPGMDIEGFTTNPLHEMETAYALDEIVHARKADLPETLVYNDKEYAVQFRVQKPWGALIDSTNESKKYGIFEYIEGISVRGEAASYGMWNDIPEVYRKFYGKMHGLLDQVAHISVEEGLEPWDLGIHQVIYQLNQETGQISLGIVDTEEFNFASDGAFWPESFSKYGLPAILLMSMLFNSYDD